MICLTFLLKKHSDFATAYYEMAYRLLAMPLACIALALLKHNGIHVVLQWFGKHSLEIYVLQMLVLGIVGQFLLAVDCNSSHFPAIQTLLTFGIVLSLCAPVHIGIDKLIRKIEK